MTWKQGILLIGSLVFIVPYLILTDLTVELELVFGVGFLLISLLGLIYLLRIRLKQAKAPYALQGNLFEMGLLAVGLFITGVLLLGLM